MEPGLPCDASALRRTFAAYPTGVSVVTVGNAGRGHGMTVSSFVSVSLDPPLVSISARAAARTARLLRRERRCGVSFLAGNQAAVARHFAGAAGDREVRFDWFQDIPLIRGAVGRLVCDVVRTVAAGDHIIFLCSVAAHWRSSGAALLFHDSAFSPAPEASGPPDTCAGDPSHGA